MILKELVLLAVVASCLIGSVFSVDPICQPYTTNVLSPAQMPQFPNLFQTRIEASFLEMNLTTELFIVYDNVDKLAELVEYRDGISARRIFRYTTNEVFTIRGKECQAGKISLTTDNWFFSITVGPSGLNMQPPNMVLHFNNGFPHIKLEQTTRRGIPVNHFRSCQSWPDFAAVFTIDYYIRVPNFEPGIVYDPTFKEVPVLAEVEGHVRMNTSQPFYFKHEYNFFDFLPHIERNPLLYSIPEGVFCKDQMFYPGIPKVPPSFSVVEETIYPELRFALTSRLHYSSELKATRIDLANAPQFTQIDVSNPVNIIHDFNNGVGYVIDEVRGDCLLYSIGNSPLDQDAVSFVSSAGTLFRQKEPNEVFLLDDTYTYAGQRVRRGILCDVFTSKRTDIKLPPSMNVTVEYFLVETYIMNTRVQIDESSDLREQFVIIAIEASAPGLPFRTVNDFYNFDSKPLSERNFNLDKCFKEKDKIRFAVRYNYPLGLDKNSFEKFFAHQIEAKFRETILSSFKIFHASPLRLLPTSVETFNETFVIFSTLTSFPEPIKQFKFSQKVSINVPGAKYVIKALNPAECAFICLNESVFDVFNYKCMSFDFCASPVGGLCSFYNASVVTDPSIVVQNQGTECDHYSKIVMNSDGASVQTLYRSVEESVARKQFDMQIVTPDSGLVINFKALDVYTVHHDRNNQASTQGFTSFFNQFINFPRDMDFNEEDMKKNSTLFLRKKTGISVDECARLCLREPSFDCHTMTYNYPMQDCKWSSLVSLLASEDDPTRVPYLVAKPGYSWFIKNVLYDYYEYPNQVASIVDYKTIEAQSDQICALFCESEVDFKCRSFNFCKQPDGGPSLCLLSPSNVHNTASNPNIQTAPSCSHFSRKGLSDFEIYPQSQLILKSGDPIVPKTSLVNTSVEICSETCLLTDTFVCRSFDYFLESSSCNLYMENIVDKFDEDAYTLTKNNNSNHYSRIYLTQNGVKVDVKPTIKSLRKYSGGTIAGVVFALIVSGFLIGVLMAFAYLKIKHKEALLPVMRYTNPNFNQASQLTQRED